MADCLGEVVGGAGADYPRPHNADTRLLTQHTDSLYFHSSLSTRLYFDSAKVGAHESWQI